MIAFKLQKLSQLDSKVQILPGANASQTDVTAVETDSRKPCAGALFIALKGERFDGHRFVQVAAKQGAAMLGIAADFYAQEKALCTYLQQSGHSLVIAPDTQRLLGLCALAVRQQSTAKVVALSGSCGKTTVKEMTAAILSKCGRVLYTQGNFNNDIGVPLTLLRLTPQIDFAVIEQGASHRGDLARTCEFVQAQSALITNVGQAHIAGFGSPEGVYLGKRELIEDVAQRGGIGIVPACGNFATNFAHDFAAMLHKGRLWTFGEACVSPQAEVTYKLHQASPAGISFTLNIRGQELTLNLPILGAHNAANAAAAAALALSVGADINAIKDGLESCQTLPGRLQRVELPGITVLDDAYNASFNAMLAGIATLGEFKDARRILVLGDMGELGSKAQDLHRQVGLAACGQCELLLTQGPLTTLTHEAFQGRKAHFASQAELCAALAKELDDAAKVGAHCCVLIKGSHSMHMDRVSDFLQRRSHAAQA